jgi:hypothetical protein
MIVVLKVSGYLKSDGMFFVIDVYMRYRILLFFFLISFISFSQTKNEREIYEDSIATAVVKSNKEVVYYGIDGKVVGYRVIGENDTNYTDNRKRSIQKKPILKQSDDDESISKSKEKSPSNSSSGGIENIDPSRLTKIVRINKIIYKKPDGSRAYVVRRHWWSKSRVTYFDAEGKRIGFKRQKNNGEVVYFDSRGRKTGKSFINASGQLVFRPEFQRETPGIMLTQFFFE